MNDRTEPSLRIDRATHQDLHLVEHSWLQSYRETFRPHSRCRAGCYAMPDAAYRPWQRERIRGLVGGGAMVLVARDPESMVYLRGWLCAERLGRELVLHYAYTKSSHRKSGVFTALLASALDALGGSGLVYTHHTRFDSKLEQLGFAYQSVERLGRAA
jgi:hypothetical protein